jgi:pyruvate dehydrogenase E2 component (dihydrolipoamide acetyltransferase)
MSVRIEMPQLSSDGESATLATWLVAVGDVVEVGDVIAELETDKATVELEAPTSGKIAELKIAAGTEGIEPGSVLGTIELGEGASTKARPDTERATDEEVESAESSAADGRRSTPLARRAAAANEVDLEAIPGSGPGGRVVEADVLRVAGGEVSPADQASATAVAGNLHVDVVPAGSAVAATSGQPVVESVREGEGFRATRLSAMRKTIARRMSESKQQVPHFYLRVRVAMDEVMAVRARLNSGLAEEGRGVKISVNDFILRAAGLALRDVPEANVQFAGDVMHVFDRVDVSVAVATEGGLVTPIVRDADRKGLIALAEEVKSLAAKAREGSLTPDQYQGGTLTISNLGMYGIETVYPILNPPQACILGVGAAEQQPVVREGEISAGWVASITLAADHRAIDGAIGAQLLAALRSRLEDPLGMML